MMLFRSIGLTPADLREAVAKKLEPKEDGFLMRVFNKNISAAQKAYDSVFIDGIKHGSLAPERYGSVNILDAYYCYEAASSIWTACSKAIHKDNGLYELLSKLYNGYAEYNQVFNEQWHVTAAKNVSPTPCFREYAEHEKRVANNEDAVYMLVALLPCYYLWYWIAHNINQDKCLHPGLYQPWVDRIDDEPDSAYLIDDFINNWQQKGKSFDESKAFDIFQTSINCEVKVFNECGFSTGRQP